MEGIVLTAQTRSQCCCYWLVCLFVPLLVLVSGCGGEPEVESTPERVLSVQRELISGLAQ